MTKPCTSLHFLPGYLCVCWGVLAEGICSTVTYFDTCMKNKFSLKPWEPQEPKCIISLCLLGGRAALLNSA